MSSSLSEQGWSLSKAWVSGRISYWLFYPSLSSGLTDQGSGNHWEAKRPSTGSDQISSPCHRYMSQYNDCWFIHLWQGLDIWSDQILLRYWSDTQVIGMWINNADMIMSVIIFLICFYRRKCCCCLRARNSGSILNQRRICRRFGEPLHLLIFFYNSTDID